MIETLGEDVKVALHCETYVYKSIAGCEVAADVYRPTEGAVPSPVIVWIHGGCLMYGTRKGIRPEQLAEYVAAGLAVVSIDYRLAPETLLPGIIEDLQDAFSWVRRQGPSLLDIDPERVAVVGHSAGGYLTLMAGWCVEPPPVALVSFYGYGDIIADWYSKPDPFYCQQPAVSPEKAYEAIGSSPITSSQGARGESQIYLYCRQNGLWPNVVMGKDPAQNPGAFAPYCPIQNIGSSYPPTLLLHGDRDTDVPYQQSVAMSQALTEHGIENELITIEGGPHGFDSTLWRDRGRGAFDRVLGFLSRHLGPA